MAHGFEVDTHGFEADKFGETFVAHRRWVRVDHRPGAET